VRQAQNVKSTIHDRDRWVPHDLVVRARTLTTKHLDGVERDLVLQAREGRLLAARRIE